MEHAHIFKKNNNFRLQGLHIKAFQHRYSKWQCETPYLEDELVQKLQKLKKCPQKKIPEWFCH